MSTAVITQALFVALALVMFGLGLSLKPADFARLRHHPKAVALALALQTLLLPLGCWALIALLGVRPVYAIGLMLLAASPGGVSANLFGHLFGGNVAMNISLTAINTLLSIVTLPLIANAAIAHFAASGQVVPLQLPAAGYSISMYLTAAVFGLLVLRRGHAQAAGSRAAGAG
ncbi:MAG TPA: hypothetical protein VFR90_12130 [Methylibium sp.]|uniref:bile acid:sodium symporter family protein n=1 Tax=Methylibium sp. TaxID=2067992 RepID=UPI002DB64A85|nr:hypothetical protein [Methylibium sp.]HEU4459863.1 hypothetical protein [Methylibium sp.]